MSFARKNLKIIGRLAFPGPINRGGPSPFFKILMVLTGVLVSTLVHDRLALALLLLMALAFALAWKARPSSLLKRLGPLILFFAVILPLPAIFIPVGSHEPVRLWILPIYANGLSAAITLCLRTSSAICWAGAGFLTEEPHKLLSALPLPSVLADIILGAHRYISLLAREAWEMFLGKLARDPVGGFRSNLLFMGSRVGLLFVRSADTGEKVYLAMRARGYPGTPHRTIIRSPPIRDIAWIAGFVMAISLIIWVA